MRFASFDPLTMVVRLIVLFTAIPIHECAHGYMASRLGDDTARYQGRLTLNPFAHLDIMGSVCLVLFGFGWAKPVNVNSRNFQHPRRDMALTSLAGPVSNVLLALAAMIIFKLCPAVFALPLLRSANNVFTVLYVTLNIIITTNLHLAVFNLLPIPPLDGSKIFGAILPDKYYYFMLQYERYVFLVLILLLYTGVLSLPLSWLSNLLYSLLNLITYPISALLS